MKIAVIVARVLMGLIFVVFGLNGFLQFMKAPLSDRPDGRVFDRPFSIALGAVH